MTRRACGLRVWLALAVRAALALRVGLLRIFRIGEIDAGATRGRTQSRKDCP